MTLGMATLLLLKVHCSSSILRIRVLLCVLISNVIWEECIEGGNISSLEGETTP